MPQTEQPTIPWHSRSDPDAMSYKRDPLKADDIMTVRELAALLHMPESTVSYLARTGVIPSRKLGRRRIFIRPLIEEILLSTATE
jgi:excisionase family DNA binding protein